METLTITNLNDSEEIIIKHIECFQSHSLNLFHFTTEAISISLAKRGFVTFYNLKSEREVLSNIFIKLQRFRTYFHWGIKWSLYK